MAFSRNEPYGFPKNYTKNTRNKNNVINKLNFYNNFRSFRFVRLAYHHHHHAPDREMSSRFVVLLGRVSFKAKARAKARAKVKCEYFSGVMRSINESILRLSEI